MKRYKNQFPIEKMCKVFEVSRSGYYAWIKRKPSNRLKENEQLISEINRIFIESRSTYGSPRMAEELKRRGYNVSRPRVARLMRKENIRSIVKKKYVVTTDSKHRYKASPNLLNRRFKTIAPNEVWVSDITYIKTKQGWLYLTVVIDLYDRKIIGWALSLSMSTRSTTAPALKMAMKNRAVNSSLIFHSDRGVQYACEEFRMVLKINSITQSMSRKGNCWDNAVAESFFKTIKSECTNHYNFNTRQEASRYIFDYIEIWYNRKRRHSYLGYKTPLEFETMYKQILAA